MISRAHAVATAAALLDDAVVVAANGMISRELFAGGDRETNFYMLGSMGLASTIGLGLALVRRERQVAVFDGDGNVLMALGHLAMIGERRPPNLHHLVFDNEVYGSTGGQRSISDRIDLDRVAAAAGYRWTRRVDDAAALAAAVAEMRRETGPTFLLVKVAPENQPGVPRVTPPPAEIAARARRAVCREP